MTAATVEGRRAATGETPREATPSGPGAMVHSHTPASRKAWSAAREASSSRNCSSTTLSRAPMELPTKQAQKTALPRAPSSRSSRAASALRRAADPNGWRTSAGRAAVPKCTRAAVHPSARSGEETLTRGREARASRATTGSRCQPLVTWQVAMLMLPRCRAPSGLSNGTSEAGRHPRSTEVWSVAAGLRLPAG